MLFLYSLLIVTAFTNNDTAPGMKENNFLYREKIEIFIINISDFITFLFLNFLTNIHFS